MPKAMPGSHQLVLPTHAGKNARIATLSEAPIHTFLMEPDAAIDVQERLRTSDTAYSIFTSSPTESVAFISPCPTP